MNQKSNNVKSLPALFVETHWYRETAKSNVPCEVAHAAFQSLGEFCQRFERDFLFRPFNVANIIPRQIGFFRQLLLTQAGLCPFGADGYTQNTINSAWR